MGRRKLELCVLTVFLFAAVTILALTFRAGSDPSLQPAVGWALRIYSGLGVPFTIVFLHIARKRRRQGR